MVLLQLPPHCERVQRVGRLLQGRTTMCVCVCVRMCVVCMHLGVGRRLQRRTTMLVPCASMQACVRGRALPNSGYILWDYLKING